MKEFRSAERLARIWARDVGRAFFHQGGPE